MNAHAAIRSLVVLGAISVLLMVAAHASAAPNAGDAYIPFVSHGGVRDWVADRDKGLWVQDEHRKWFYASMLGPCVGLEFATRVAFDTRPMDRLDQWSAVIVPGTGRCTIQSFKSSDGPSVKQKKSAVAHPAA